MRGGLSGEVFSRFTRRWNSASWSRWSKRIRTSDDAPPDEAISCSLRQRHEGRIGGRQTAIRKRQYGLSAFPFELVVSRSLAIRAADFDARDGFDAARLRSRLVE